MAYGPVYPRANWSKFSQFLSQAQLVFNGSSLDYQDVHQMIKRHVTIESLTVMLDDTSDRLDKLKDTISKIEFINVI
jgi:hypothetical protein